MYEGPNTPLVNAMVPGGGVNMQESFEPMAANEGFGGFGSF